MADWRPLVGLTPDDAGSLWESVITRVVYEGALDAHNRDAQEARR